MISEDVYGPCPSGLIMVTKILGVRKDLMEEKINPELYKAAKHFCGTSSMNKKTGFYFNTIELCQRVIRGLFLLPRNGLQLLVKDLSLAQLLIRITQINFLYFWHQQIKSKVLADQILQTIRKIRKTCRQLLLLNESIKSEEVELIGEKMRSSLSGVIKLLKQYIQMEGYHDPHRNPAVLKLKYVLLNMLRKSKEKIKEHIDNKVQEHFVPDVFKGEEQEIYIIISYLYMIMNNDSLDQFFEIDKSSIKVDTQMLLLQAFQSFDGMPRILHYLQDAPFQTLQKDKSQIESLFFIIEKKKN